MSESPPPGHEFPVPGHQLPPAGSDSADPHRAPITNYGRSPVMVNDRYPLGGSSGAGHQSPVTGSGDQSPVMGEARYPAEQGTNHQSPDDEEISLLDILIVLAKHKKLVLGLPFLAAVIAAGITLLMPNWYTATAKLLPPQQSQSNALAILGQLGALSGGASSALGIKNPSDIFVAMLKSRTVADALAERFNLKDLYNTQFVQDARKALAGNTNIVAGRDGVITIEVDDKSPQRAAD
jgi:hypothetical protein